MLNFTRLEPAEAHPPAITPGPWIISENENKIWPALYWCISSSDGRLIACVDAGEDARLIKAAPDLLPALVAMIHPWSGLANEELRPRCANDMEMRHILNARAAIAQATGGGA